MKNPPRRKSTVRESWKLLTRPTPSEKVEAPHKDEAQGPIKVPETDGWYTRNQASDILRCSLQTLKNYEIRGLLHPKYGVREDSTGAERTMIVYDPQELSKLPSKKPGGPNEYVREPGEQAARAFEMFRQGLMLDEVVIELRETPERIEYLHERWLDHTKARYVIAPEAKKLLEQIVGSFSSVTELIERIEQKFAAPARPFAE